MKLNVFLLFVLTCVGAGCFAQQNPNFQHSQDQYAKLSKSYTNLQGTTSQETYKAIDELEERRELRAYKRRLRAEAPKRRHERQLERIKNRPHYYLSNYDSYNLARTYRPYCGFRLHLSNRICL
ncbi:MAG: hypothetical protein ACPG4W_02875 [Flavobacteriales bacterium]